MAQPSPGKKARIEEAYKRIKEGGEKLRTVCRELDLPRSTVYDKVKGNTPITWYKHELSPEEETQLATWILECADCAFPCNVSISLIEVGLHPEPSTKECNGFLLNQAMV